MRRAVDSAGGGPSAFYSTSSASHSGIVCSDWPASLAASTSLAAWAALGAFELSDIVVFAVPDGKVSNRTGAKWRPGRTRPRWVRSEASDGVRES